MRHKTTLLSMQPKKQCRRVTLGKKILALAPLTFKKFLKTQKITSCQFLPLPSLNIQSKTPQHLHPWSWGKSAHLLQTGASPNQVKVLFFPFSRLALSKGQLCCALHAVTATLRQEGQAFLLSFGQACHVR